MEYKKEIIELEPFHMEWNGKTGDDARIVIFGTRPKGTVHYEIRIKFKSWWPQYIAKILRKWLNGEIKEKEKQKEDFVKSATEDRT